MLFGIVDTHDVFSQKGSNIVAYGIADGGMSPTDEAKRLNRADVIIAIHSGDAAALKTLVPHREVLVSGVDATVLQNAEWPNRPAVLPCRIGQPLKRDRTQGFSALLLAGRPRTGARRATPNRRRCRPRCATGEPAVVVLGTCQI